MDRQRTLFYGFIIGLAIFITPIPSVLYWMDDNEAAFRYIGFIISLICGARLIIEVILVFLKDVQNFKGK